MARIVELIHTLHRSNKLPPICLSLTFAALLPKRGIQALTYTQDLIILTCNAHWFKVRTTRVSNPIWYSYLNGSTSAKSRIPPRPPKIPDNIIIFYLYIIGIVNFLLTLVLRYYKWIHYSLDLSYNFLNGLAILYAQ